VWIRGLGTYVTLEVACDVFGVSLVTWSIGFLGGHWFATGFVVLYIETFSVVPSN
jgi:hypothetical protein